MNYQPPTRGFTLVEMSIVLVIIGLILGGVMGGQSLVRASRLNSVVTDMHKFEAYLGSFRLKYDALPGDMKNAVSYWPVATYTTMVNGDGNGQIPWETEGFQAWLHLTASEIMPGSYTGTVTDGNAVIGTNVPASRVDGVGYYFSGGTSIYGQRGNFISFGKPIAGSALNGSFVTPSEAQSIDQKIDDGLADHGNVLALDGNDAPSKSCTKWTVNRVTAPAPYELTTTIESCFMSFKIE